MSPVWIVIGLVLVLRVIGAAGIPAFDSWIDSVRIGTGITFVIMGLAHMTPIGKDVRRLVPPWLPRPGLIVLLLGVWQIAGGLGLINYGTRRVAAATLFVLLVLKLPANVRAARQSLRLPGKMSTSPVWRVPAQILWLALVLWSGK
jgi:uncharacterized membrane protein